MKNILITSGGRRVSLVRAFQKELKKIYPSGKVIVTDSCVNLSSAAQIADSCIEICKIDSDQYIDVLLKLCLENEVKIIVPTLDPELVKLAKNKALFLKYNIEIIISSEIIVEISEDKLKTQELFKSLNIKVAEVYGRDNYKIPMFIKPINGSNSVDNYIIKNKSQISRYHLENTNLQFFEYLDPKIFDEFTCDLYYDKKSQLKCVIPRKRIEIKGGEVSKGVTKRNGVKDFIETNLSYLEGAHGCITLQVFMHKESHEIYGIEINARFGGGFPLSYLAGGNFPKWIIEEYMLNNKIPYFDNWKDDLLMLRYDDEILVENYKN